MYLLSTSIHIIYNHNCPCGCTYAWDICLTAYTAASKIQTRLWCLSGSLAVYSSTSSLAIPSPIHQ
uniref:Uncharacterized protein n=1 Tax=Anguilla anguilla TaxID=7936 RepID=A0A0E9QK31_ANGAN